MTAYILAEAIADAVQRRFGIVNVKAPVGQSTGHKGVMRTMRVKSALLALCVTAFGMSSAAVAQDLLPRDNGIYNYHRAPRYRPSESHPLRIFAYLVHPIGWIAREGIFRPISAFTSSTTFTRSFFGYREPFDYREAECFSSSDAIPDCRQVPPYTNIGGVAGSLVSGGPAEEEMVDSGERQVFFPDVNFEFDKAQLNDLGRGRVRQIAQLLASVPSLSVVIEGHTDFVGSDEYNQSLGERRAQAVIGELVELGIDPNRLSPISYGEGKPVFTEEEDWARAVNRRVQFSVGAAEEATEVSAEAEG